VITVSETKHVAMNKAQQAQLDSILRGVCKDRKCAVEADLDSRLSYRLKDADKPKQAVWEAYSRFLLSDGHTVYVALRTMKASVSSKPDKFAIAKVEKRLARQKKKAARIVKFDPKLSTLEATTPKQHSKGIVAAALKATLREQKT
jgi:hypothetical protein